MKRRVRHGDSVTKPDYYYYYYYYFLLVSPGFDRLSFTLNSLPLCAINFALPSTFDCGVWFGLPQNEFLDPPVVQWVNFSASEARGARNKIQPQLLFISNFLLMLTPTCCEIDSKHFRALFLVLLRLIRVVEC